MEKQPIKGIVIVNSCNAMRSLYHTWQRYVSSSLFVHFMNVPRVSNSLAVEYFKKEIQKLITALEAHSGRKIEESAIAEAIDIYNESRDSMRILYEMRKNARLPLKGNLVYKIVQESQRIPRKIFNKKLKELIEGIREQEMKASRPDGPRIMITGSLLANSQLIEIIEEAGAFVVCDDLCFGRRYFEGNVEKANDLLEAISTRYLLKPPVPV